jgi:hypothetical protein
VERFSSQFERAARNVRREVDVRGGMFLTGRLMTFIIAALLIYLMLKWYQGGSTDHT